MTPTTQGILAIVAASMIWGVTGLYLSTLQDVPPLEVLAHRTFWSLIFFVGLFAIQGRLRRFFSLFADATAMRTLFISALAVTCNWGLFIWAVQVGRAAEASLGYYIFPLVAALMGALILKESLNRATQIAVGLAVLAVVVIAWEMGTFPWLSLLLATTFGVYGLVKRRLEVSPLMSVAIETALISPLLVLWMLYTNTGLGAFTESPLTAAKLIGLVLVTGLPLVFFSMGTQKLNYATLGLIQYINPTMQFFVAITILGEPIRPSYAIALPLIWLGLGLFSWDALARERRKTRA